MHCISSGDIRRREANWGFVNVFFCGPLNPSLSFEMVDVVLR